MVAVDGGGGTREEEGERTREQRSQHQGCWACVLVAGLAMDVKHITVIFKFMALME